MPHAAYDAASSSGSLFDPRGIGSQLVSDARAQTVNDVVIVVIDEQATARRDASTSSSNKMSVQLSSRVSWDSSQNYRTSIQILMVLRAAVDQ